MDERQHDYYVELLAIIDRMKLKNITPEVSVEDIRIYQSDLNRPALQLAGFFDYFDSERVQVIGKIEHTYIHNMFPSELKEILRKLFSAHIPCVIFTRDLEVPQMMIDFAREYAVPIFQTPMATSNFNSDLNRFLKSELAPRTSIHGVLVDVYGEGVLIIGESGIGKSETALELIRRGHRLVADDVVEVKKVSDEMIIGTSPDIIRHFIELRGIGIVDCKMLFGVQSVKDDNEINMVIQLQEWRDNADFDRLGLIEEHMDILGVDVPSHTLPIRPGRNLAIIVESAAINYRQKKMGYNAAEEINKRVMGNLEKAKETNKNKA